MRMNIKIYNKKGFWSGVWFLLLAVGSIILLINNPHGMNTTRNIKSILATIICVLIGITQVYRGLDSQCTKEDEQNDDERNKLVVLKAESSAYRITFYLCMLLTILLATAVGVAKFKGSIDVATFNGLLGIFVGVAIVPTIMIISYTAACIYHEKRT